MDSSKQMNPGMHLVNMLGNIKGLMDFAEAQADDPNRTPEERAQMKAAIKEKFTPLKKQMKDITKKVNDTFNNNAGQSK